MEIEFEVTVLENTFWAAVTVENNGTPADSDGAAEGPSIHLSGLQLIGACGEYVCVKNTMEMYLKFPGKKPMTYDYKRISDVILDSSECVQALEDAR